MFSGIRYFIKNTNNHLPVYPYEMCNDTDHLCLRDNIHRSFIDMPVDQDIIHTVEFFMQVFTMAKQNEICLALFYNSDGVNDSKFKMYGKAVNESFPNKPTIIISVFNHIKNWWINPASNTKCIELKNQECISFFDHSNINSLIEKGISTIEKIAVIKFRVLPKFVMDRLCLYSTTPIYAPEASTANLAECFRKPYLRNILDINFNGRVDQSSLNSWNFINKVFTKFNVIEFESAKELLSTISEGGTTLKACDIDLLINKRKILSETDEKIMLLLNTCAQFTEFMESHKRYISNNIKPECKDYKVSNIYCHHYFKFMLENNMHVEFCQYICDEVNRVMIYYIQESTAVGGVFYEIEKTLQQQALHPDNNMIFNQLDDYW